jgi:hypothetical protein
MSEAKQLQRALLSLRQDAIRRGLKELAICYGWSVIRIGEELLTNRSGSEINPHIR